MDKGILGSSPRRLIKRTHNRNPTFHSFLVNDVMHHDPVPQNVPRSNRKDHSDSLIKDKKQDITKYYLSAGRSNSTGKIEFDSLYRAEEDFSKKKLRNPVYYSSQAVQESEEALYSSRPKSNSSFLASAINNLNFRSGAQIQIKQAHGFDIISNQ